MTRSLMIQNFLLFQIGWFCCVVGGASSDFYMVGVFAVFAIVVIHLLRAGNMKDEVLLIASTTLIGTVWDSGLMLAGLFTFYNGVTFDQVAPLWLIAMWALFATTLNVSLKWMKQRYLLAAVFGAIGGPIAYYAGSRIGAVGFDHTLSSIIAVSIGWMLIMPSLMAISNKFNGYKHETIKVYEVHSL